MSWTALSKERWNVSLKAAAIRKERKLQELRLINSPPEAEAPEAVPETPAPEMPKPLRRVRYRKTPCGWREPMLPAARANMPARVKTHGALLARLQKMGAAPGSPDEDGWIPYVTKQGTVGRVRLLGKDALK